MLNSRRRPPSSFFWIGQILNQFSFFKGLILVLPCIDVFVKVDLRTVTCNIPPQEVQDQTGVAKNKTLWSGKSFNLPGEGDLLRIHYPHRPGLLEMLQVASVS